MSFRQTTCVLLMILAVPAAARATITPYSDKYTVVGFTRNGKHVIYRKVWDDGGRECDGIWITSGGKRRLLWNGKLTLKPQPARDGGHRWEWYRPTLGDGVLSVDSKTLALVMNNKPLIVPVR